MGQRITIQYSVDLEDLESEVGKMIKQVSQKLEGCGEDLEHTVGLGSAESLSLRMLGELIDMRERIGKIDYTLVDISNIISSYVQYTAQPPQQQEAQPSETVSEEELEAIREKLQQIPKVEQMQDAIENFKNSVEKDEVTD
jgi:hypothetical protein